jgi:hypothetical protein
MKQFKCSICGKTWGLEDVTRARKHVHARHGKCAEQRAVLLLSSLSFQPSHRSAGGREVAHIFSEPNVPNPDRQDDDTDLPQADLSQTDTNFANVQDEPTTSESADNSNDAIMKLLDILVAEDDDEKICDAFNCTRQERAPEPCMILDEIESETARPRPVLNYSQRRIVELRRNFKLKLGAANAIMELVADTRFDPQELGTGNVRTIENRLRRGHDGGDVREFDFHTELDGRQDLKMYLRDPVRFMEEIFGDPIFKDHIILTFNPTFDEDGGRTFGSAMGGLWAQFNMCALKKHDGAEVLLALAVYIDVSFVKVHLSVKPIFGNSFLLHWVHFFNSRCVAF